MCRTHHTPIQTRDHSQRPRGHHREAAPRPRGSERVSDTEREQTVTHLRDAASAGLLDINELEQRLERTWAARTRDELGAVTLDVEHWINPRKRARRHHAGPRTGLRYSLIAWLCATAVMAAIWLLTGMSHPWLAWPTVGAAPWLIAQWRKTHGTTHRARDFRL